jgi:hypothetical protein
LRQKIPLGMLRDQLCYASFPYFMSQLRDVDGRALEVAPHQERWCHLAQHHPSLVILAPRSHGKSTLGHAFVLWLFFRHGRTPDGRPRAASAGSFQAVLFSATQHQAGVHVDRFRDLLAANADLVAAQGGGAGSDDGRRARASMTQVRLENGAELLARAYGTSTRGLHPDLVLLDDVVSDQNSGSHTRREDVWAYFAGTILPMHPERILAVGTAVHHDDLLQRLKPRPDRGLPDGGTRQPPTPVFGFAWHAYQAIEAETETALWPSRYSYASLAAIQAEEPIVFAREYLNDPRDDTASLFPSDLTQVALDAGALLSFVSGYRPRPGEWVLAGVDLARSEAIGADWLVAIVIAYEIETGIRRVLTIRRHRGLDFNQMRDLLVELAESYGIQLGIIEQNGVQRWALDALKERMPHMVYFGYNTGREKVSLLVGVPALKRPLLDGRWILPCGDPASRHLAKLWQAEMSAMGWRDGTLAATGEHDDLVMATWFVERAVGAITTAPQREPTWEPVPLTELGIPRVRISPDLY